MRPKEPNRERAERVLRKLRALAAPTDKADSIKPDGIVLKLRGDISPLGPISAKRVEYALACYPTAPVELIIHSGGGSVHEANRIIAALDKHKGHVTGTVPDACCSAAIGLFLACGFRQGSRGAIFQVHSPEVRQHASDDTRWTADRHRSTAKFLDRVTDELIALYAARTKQPAAKFRAEIQSEDGMDGTAAMRLGILHAFTDEVEWKHGRPYHWPQDLITIAPLTGASQFARFGRPWSLPRSRRIFC
jgi:ATP-dependent protease ClpP protease subunit